MLSAKPQLLREGILSDVRADGMWQASLEIVTGVTRPRRSKEGLPLRDFRAATSPSAGLFSTTVVDPNRTLLKILLRNFDGER